MLDWVREGGCEGLRWGWGWFGCGDVVVMVMRVKGLCEREIKRVVGLSCILIGFLRSEAFWLWLRLLKSARRYRHQRCVTDDE